MNKHKNTKKHTKKYRKTNYKRRKQNTKTQNTRKHKRHYTKRIYKHKEFTPILGSQSIPIFSKPDKTQSNSIIIDREQNYGNIITGLRNFLKK
jgi:hypothetical protein